jgi:hypothetical protein
MGRVSLDFGLTTVSSCFLIWLDTVRDQPVPTFPIVDEVFAFLLAKVQSRYTGRVFDKSNDRKLARVYGLDLQPVLVAIRTVGSVCPL